MSVTCRLSLSLTGRVAACVVLVFCTLRARLSYEQFSQFLVAIKDLNAGRTSREDTLASAKALFGSNNTDLYGECHQADVGEHSAVVVVLTHVLYECAA